jgi:hypothetical protein
MSKSPWAVPSSSAKPKPNFNDIMSEQEASRVTDGSDITTGEIISMQEYLVNWNKETGTYDSPKVAEDDEDVLLAKAIQEIETEDYLLGQRDHLAVVSEQNNSKVTVQHQEAVQSSMPRAVSSQWREAVAVENMVLQKSSDSKQYYKHDPLLQGISNASSLTELEGVGDLVNAGILINDNVANSLKVSIKQMEDKEYSHKRKS